MWAILKVRGRDCPRDGSSATGETAIVAPVLRGRNRYSLGSSFAAGRRSQAM
jgi:hypothetical protein